MEMDGALVIAWEADGYRSIRVRAPRRDHQTLMAFARDVADEALIHRSIGALRNALRDRFAGSIELEARGPRFPGEPHVLVTLRPPRGVPRPDPGD
jgi:hypothetical protein